ncbi:MAG: CDP-diacylglycerol--glycerol-3-phosphate 3-phosphatidyltransferase [Clostridiales bacterium]|nr:MAG: CDP-diacylglycerol--glycerol-3-phosphate 3-phosphatidyltransferase [Clostridiales bacterium]
MTHKNTRFHGQYFTIPNLLSYLRLALIPLIVWLYCSKEAYLLAAGLMAFSAATDIADGWIARHYNLITDWGKIIDPIADKLTQIAVALCLAYRFTAMRFLLILLVVKELYMAVIGLVFIHKTDVVEGSVWYGKLTTVLFFLVTLTLILLPNLAETAALILVLIESAAVLISMVLYTVRYVRLYHQISAARQAGNPGDPTP